MNLNILNSIRLNSFIYGNFELSNIQKFINDIERSYIPTNTEKQPPIYFTKYHQFSPNEKAVIDINAQLPDVAIIDAKWQQHSFMREAVGKVLAKIISPSLFKQIRTEEQLGYSVGFYSTVIDQQITYAWYVQTPVKSPIDMMARFDSFRIKFLPKLSKMSEDEIEQYRQSVLIPLTQNNQNIYQENQDYLYDWQKGNFDFNNKSQLIEAIKQVSHDDLITLYKKILNENGMARIITQVKGNNFEKDEFIKI